MDQQKEINQLKRKKAKLLASLHKIVELSVLWEASDEVIAKMSNEAAWAIKDHG